MEYKDYYAILGVPKTADADEIKRTYRKLAKKYHPDANPDGREAAEAKFKEVSEAYEVLGNAEKRKKYDEMSDMMNRSGGRFDPSQFAGFGNGGGTYTWTGGGDSAFSDFFNSFFGDGFGGFGGGTSYNFGGAQGFGGFGPQGHSHAHGGCGGSCGGCGSSSRDVEADVTIGVKEAYSGTQRMVRVSGKSINAKIPAGIGEGERIRMAGAAGGADLYLKVHIEDEDGFSLKDGVSEKIFELYPWEAALGCKKSVETFSGTVSVNVPAGIGAGKRMRIPSRGFKDRKGTASDLYLVIRIVNPAVITPELKELYEKMRDAQG